MVLGRSDVVGVAIPDDLPERVVGLNDSVDCSRLGGPSCTGMHI
jgi:hypothetical protein